MPAATLALITSGIERPRARTRRAAARSRARPRPAARRRSRPCRRPRPTRAGSCARSATPGSSWPSSEPSAPPVTMIGPSAPNGPPVPIATAADSGLATAVRGAIRLCLVSTASIASGMPWPRMIGAHCGDRSRRSARRSTATITMSGLRCRCVNDGSVPRDAMEEREVGEQRDQVHEHIRGPPPGRPR